MPELEISKKGKAAVPAFPLAAIVPPNGLQTMPQFFMNTGMDLRDYFAAQAVPCMLEKYFAHPKEMEETREQFSDESGIETVAMACYEFADVMLKARQL